MNSLFIVLRSHINHEGVIIFLAVIAGVLSIVQVYKHYESLKAEKEACKFLFDTAQEMDNKGFIKTAQYLYRSNKLKFHIFYMSLIILGLAIISAFSANL